MSQNPNAPCFFYAQELEAPEREGDHDAYAFGELRQRGNDGAARFSPSRHIIYGQVRELSLEEIHELDRFEAPEYERTLIVVVSGGKSFSAWAYRYVMPDFNELPLIYDGHFKGPEEG